MMKNLLTTMLLLVGLTLPVYTACASDEVLPDPDAKYIAIALTKYEKHTNQSTYGQITTQRLARAEVLTGG